MPLKRTEATPVRFYGIAGTRIRRIQRRSCAYSFAAATSAPIQASRSKPVDKRLCSALIDNALTRAYCDRLPGGQGEEINTMVVNSHAPSGPNIWRVNQ
jgi:hypothetical protein